MAAESANIKKQTISALLWNGIDKFGMNFIYLVLGIVLARLLSPSDYGVMGIITVFVNVSNILIDSGFGGAIIRKKETIDTDVNTVFFFNIFSSVVLYIILFFAAPSIASFYKDESLVWFSRIAFLSLIVSALGSLQSALLSKEIDFKNQTIANVIALSIGGITAIVMALNNMGVWALVTQSVLYPLLRTSYLWVASSWRPKLQFSKESFKELFSFTGAFLMGSLVNVVHLNLNSLFIGKMFHLSALGYYTQANKWNDMFVSTIIGIFQRATLPIFSTIQDDPARLLRYYRKVMRIMAFLTFPLLAGLTIFAHPIVLVVLSDKWEMSVPYIQILAIGGIAYAFMSINTNFLIIQGNSKIYLFYEVMKLVFSLIAIAITAQFGPIGMILGFTIARYLVYIIYALIVGKRVNYSFLTQIKDIMPYGVITAVLSIAIGLMIHTIDSAWIQLTVGGPLFVTLYLLTVYFLGSTVMKDCISLLKRKEKA